MGTTNSVDEFAGKITKLATTTQKRSELIVRSGANATKGIMLAAAASRGVKPGGKLAGKSWTVRYDLTRGAEPSALVRFTGPFHLVNNPTKAHEIVAGKGRRKKAKALRIGENVRASAQHPGTRGKHIFEAGRDTSGRTVPRIMAAQLVQGWREVLQ